MMLFGEFGRFSTFLEPTVHGVLGYETLLDLPDDDDTQIVIGRIAEALRADDSQKWITALLATRDWRPQLVAAIVFLLDQRAKLDITPLWGAIDADSWVAPQLIVTALFSDRAFASRAIERMETGGPVTRCRDGKLLASILSVCSMVPSLAAREGAWRADAEIAALLEQDSWDGSEEITRAWLSDVRKHFLKRGITLAPAAC